MSMQRTIARARARSNKAYKPTLGDRIGKWLSNLFGGGK